MDAIAAAESGAGPTAAPDAVTGAGVEPAPDAGVEPAPEVGAVAAAGERPPTILLYTRFFEYDLLRPLEVLARVRQRHATTRLVVAGKGLFGEERAFLDAARASGLGDAVDYRGWVSEAAAAELFAAADVALYPFDDTLVNRAKSSVKVLELLGAGLPVVAEAVGELIGVIEDGRTGRLVPPGDVAAFAAATSDLLADPAARRAMGAATAARIQTDHHWSSRVAALESVYASVLARRR
jgi:glycosyltransferase involved in cell wall biosynthesis